MTPKVLVTVTQLWVDVIGSAASVAGTTWQNLGKTAVYVSSNTTSPSASTPYSMILPGQSLYDKTGSAHLWARAGGAGSILSAVSE